MVERRQECTIMLIQKNITLQINHSSEKVPSNITMVDLNTDCDINIQVANGWAINGHYRNQILQTITLLKVSSKENVRNG
jgi:hypothetical protein